MSKISMTKLIKNYRKSTDEVEGGKYADKSPSELVYNIISEVEELRNDVAVRLNEMDEMLVDMKNMVEGNNKMVIDPNQFDDSDGVVNGKKVNPMRISSDGSHLRNKRRDNDLLNANLTKR